MASVMRPRPRILHLLSDWRWGATAEGIVDQCRRLRRHGHNVDLACARAPGQYPFSLEHHARERRVEPIFDLELRPGLRHAASALRDVATLTEFIDREDVQILHVHAGHGHYIASRAARRTQNLPFVVRTNHRASPLPNTALQRWLIKGHTQGWVAYAERCRDEDARNFGIAHGHAIAVEAAVNLERFAPSADVSPARAKLGLSGEHVAAGVPIGALNDKALAAALERALREEPALRVVALRDAAQRASAPPVDPALRDRVILPGAQNGDAGELLRAMDFVICPACAPEADCYCARAAMACGKPVLAGRDGLLASVVESCRCGIVSGALAEALAQGILRLARDERLRENLGRAAPECARVHFDPEKQAEAIAELYLKLAEGV